VGVGRSDRPAGHAAGGGDRRSALRDSVGAEGERGSDWVGGGRAVVVGRTKAHSVVLQLIKDFQAKSNFK
jgi:hypothetical protein